MPKVIVFDPTANQSSPQGSPTPALAERTVDLASRTIGLLWNTKGNADVYLDQVAQLLSEKYPGVRTVLVEKQSASMPMGPDHLAALVECDAVVSAFGD